MIKVQQGNFSIESLIDYEYTSTSLQMIENYSKIRISQDSTEPQLFTVSDEYISCEVTFQVCYSLLYSWFQKFLLLLFDLKDKPTMELISNWVAPILFLGVQIEELISLYTALLLEVHIIVRSSYPGLLSAIMFVFCFLSLFSFRIA